MGLFSDLVNKLRGSGLDKLPYQDTFHSSNWWRATFKERLAALQKLENECAEQHYRSPLRVEPQKMPYLEMVGVCVYTEKKIAINEEYLNPQKTDSYISREIMPYMLVDTVLHEGRHAYQKEAIKQPEMHANIDEVQKWRENEVVYYDGDHLERYRFQPQEIDANDFARGQFEKIYELLEEKYGQSLGYEAFTKFRDQSDALFIDLAKEELGENYIEKINTEIHRKYELQRSENLQKTHEKTCGFGKKNELPAISDAKKLPNNMPSKLLYNFYASEIQHRGQNLSQDKADKEICLQMMKDGRSTQRIQDALRHSPAMKGLAGSKRTVKAMEVVRDVGKTREAMNLARVKEFER